MSNLLFAPIPSVKSYTRKSKRCSYNIIKFKVHVQKNLEDYEEFVVDEVSMASWDEEYEMISGM